MAVQLVQLTDLSKSEQLRELNRMLEEINTQLDLGGLRVEVIRGADKNPSPGVGGVGADVPRLRAVQDGDNPGDAGKVKLQFFTGREWVDV
jgi:hypothetical protein